MTSNIILLFFSTSTTAPRLVLLVVSSLLMSTLNRTIYRERIMDIGFGIILVNRSMSNSMIKKSFGRFIVLKQKQGKVVFLTDEVAANVNYEEIRDQRDINCSKTKFQSTWKGSHSNRQIAPWCNQQMRRI